MDSDRALAVGVCVFLGLLVVTIVLVLTGWSGGTSTTCQNGDCHYSDLITNPGTSGRTQPGMGP